ncbi:MAG: hypothetical protein ACMUHY_01970 [Thermoplasmatota archaeon]
MPKMTSKITMKIEPKLLERIQSRADSEGLAVSSYIRKAVISYIGERKEDPRTIRFEMTPLEIRAINKLRGLGVVRSKEDAYHNAFDVYLKLEYDNVVSRAKEMIIEDHLARGVDLPGPQAAETRNDPEGRVDMDLVLEDEDI